MFKADQVMEDKALCEARVWVCCLRGRYAVMGRALELPAPGDYSAAAHCKVCPRRCIDPAQD